MPPAAKASSSSAAKRPADREASISPPPLKRKAQTGTSSSTVANFFTPASQKPKDRTVWSERAPDGGGLPTLLVGKYVPEGAGDEDLRSKRRKIAAFDLDSTLIATASGKKLPKGAADWKWWDRCVPDRLKELYNEEGYRLVVFTNQGGLTLHPDPKSKAPKDLNTRVPLFKQKCSDVLTQLNLPLNVYAATGKDIYRKPRTGMWTEMCDDYDLAGSDIDLENSIFVGDAGGRMAQPSSRASTAKDFSCSDRNLAHNLGIRYQTPEEFFLGERPREFARDFDLEDFPFSEEEGPAAKFEKKSDREVILFCGPPGAGKSTFYWKHLKPLGYERVNQDKLKSKEKCFKAAAEYLQEGGSVAIDNTNAEPATRTQWVELARKNKASIRCVWFRTPMHLCQHNDVVRSLNSSLNPESRASLPRLAFNGFTSRFKEPKLTEGFQEIIEVDFKFRGTKEDYEIWGKYWL